MTGQSKPTNPSSGGGATPVAGTITPCPAGTHGSFAATDTVLIGDVGTANPGAAAASAAEKATAQVRNVELDKIHYSQDFVSPETRDGMSISEVAKNMKENGWDGTKAPPDMVEFPGKITTLDHRRLVAAKQAGIKEVPAKVHPFDEPVPSDEAKRFILREGADFIDPFTGKQFEAGDVPSTWSEAAMFRSANQRTMGAPDFPLTGSPNVPRIGRKRK